MCCSNIMMMIINESCWIYPIFIVLMWWKHKQNSACSLSASQWPLACTCGYKLMLTGGWPTGRLSRSLPVSPMEAHAEEGWSGQPQIKQQKCWKKRVVQRKGLGVRIKQKTCSKFFFCPSPPEQQQEITSEGCFIRINMKFSPVTAKSCIIIPQTFQTFNCHPSGL